MNSSALTPAHAVEADVRNWVRRFLETWLHLDDDVPARVMAFVADDFVGIGTAPGDYYETPAAFEAMIRREQQSSMAYESRLEVLGLDVRMLQPTLALALGQLRSEIDAGAVTYVVEPRFSLISERREDRWQMVHCHFSFADAQAQEGNTLIEALEGRNRELEREVARRTAELERSLAELQAAQARLVHQEKMASLGSLTAGIAHELKNPLNFVTNFAVATRELAADLRDEDDPEEKVALLHDMALNLDRIEAHGQRADAIVRSMMQHAQGNEGRAESVNLNALVAEYVDLAYHGWRARHAREIAIECAYAADVDAVHLIPQQVSRVVVNLLHNAFDAVSARADTGEAAYRPHVRVTTQRTGADIAIAITDNGTGIAPDVQARLFEPFFTTKPPGSGTGLGLSLAHDIVTQGHGGRLTVESVPGEGATFVVSLPVSGLVATAS